jgi:flavodoxin I
MKAIVIYDSLYGNTAQIANAIGEGVGMGAKVVRLGEADLAELAYYDLIIIGSPTQGGRYAPTMKAFLDKIPAGALKNKSVAAFDTRLKTAFVKIFGYAAGRIADALKKRGANLVVPAQPFIVKSTKGPLIEGELEKAKAWGKTVAEAYANAGKLDRP